jgi:ADP-heptose:LPS heptosyltransferase
MVLDAIAMVRANAPQAQIDLAVGSWNLALARLIPGIDSVETMDAPWMARTGHGQTWSELARHAWAWRQRDYDLAMNFEPDIRSNLLLALSGARRRVGFVSGGGAAALTDGILPDPGAHIAERAKALAVRAFPSAKEDGRVHRLNIPDDARRQAAALMSSISPRGITVGIQPGAGYQIKEWTPARYAEVGATLVRRLGVQIMLIGSGDDRAALDGVRAAWPVDVPLTQLPERTDLVVLAAVLEKLALFITGDTGPMHLASTVGTPVLAIFGPSLPTRYGPLAARSRMVRIDIHCSPCNLLRRPPQRCIGHVPDCLAGITSHDVLRAAYEMLNAS